MRNISHEILREWFRRWYAYATEVRRDPIASAVPYRLARLAICQDALETIMLREGIVQEEIEGLRAEIDSTESIFPPPERGGLQSVEWFRANLIAGFPATDVSEGSCLRGPEEMRGCPGPDYITCPKCADWKPAPGIIHPHKVSAGEKEVVVEQKFHSHLDKCQQCRDHPFALCPKGAALLEEEAFGPLGIPAGQSERDREFREALRDDQTKCQRGDWGR